MNSMKWLAKLQSTIDGIVRGVISRSSIEAFCSQTFLSLLYTRPRIRMTVLSVKTIFFLLAVAVTAVAGESCWWKLGNMTYPDLMHIRVNNPYKCKAHCFDLDQLLGLCSVFALDDKCHRAVNSDKPEYKNAKDQKGKSTYLLKDECRGDGCWSKSYEHLTGLSVVEADDERHCKFICLETEDCYHYAYDNNTCYIQNHKVLLEGTFGHGQLYRLRGLCKRETCWSRFDNQDTTFDELKPLYADGDFDCRVKCLELEVCSVYKWNKRTGECHIMMEASKGKAYLEQKDGIVTYFYESHCAPRSSA